MTTGSVFCQHCEKELSTDHKGPCPYCGKVGKKVIEKASCVIEFKASASAVHEGIRKIEKTDSGCRYLKQFDRVKRWYEEFKLTDQERLHDHSADFYQDQVYAFFQNCWHLKDWIIYDKSAGPTKKDVEDFINCHCELKLCADICNGTKHLCRNRETRSGEDPQFKQREFELALGTEPTISVKYTIVLSNGQTVDAFDLATKCLDLWEIFIREQVLSKTGAK